MLCFMDVAEVVTSQRTEKEEFELQALSRFEALNCVSKECNSIWKRVRKWKTNCQNCRRTTSPNWVEIRSASSRNVLCDHCSRRSEFSVASFATARRRLKAVNCWPLNLKEFDALIKFSTGFKTQIQVVRKAEVDGKISEILKTRIPTELECW